MCLYLCTKPRVLVSFMLSWRTALSNSSKKTPDWHLPLYVDCLSLGQLRAAIFVEKKLMITKRSEKTTKDGLAPHFDDEHRFVPIQQFVHLLMYYLIEAMIFNSCIACHMDMFKECIGDVCLQYQA